MLINDEKDVESTINEQLFSSQLDMKQQSHSNKLKSRKSKGDHMAIKHDG